jgi:hypothetical protein
MHLYIVQSSYRQQQCHLCQPYGAAAEAIRKRRNLWLGSHGMPRAHALRSSVNRASLMARLRRRLTRCASSSKLSGACRLDSRRAHNSALSQARHASRRPLRMVAQLTASTSSAGARSRAALGQVRAGGATLGLRAYIPPTDVSACCVAGHSHPAHVPLLCTGQLHLTSGHIWQLLSRR